MMSSELLLGASTVAATAAAFSDSVGIIMYCFGLCIWNKGMLVAYYEMSFVSVAISNY